MATYRAIKMRNAKLKARAMRRKGLKASIYKLKSKKGYGISVTRGK